MSATHIGLTQPNFVAGGTINRGRFITPSTTVAQTVIQSASAGTALLCGVSSRWVGPAGLNAALTSGFDTVAALTGDPVPYNGMGTIGELQLGGTVSDPSIPLTSDTSGKGVAASSTNFAGAIALRLGVADEYIPVFVLPPGQRY